MSFIINVTKGRGFLLALILVAFSTTSCIDGDSRRSSTFVPGAPATSQDSIASSQASTVGELVSSAERLEAAAVSTPEPLPIVGLLVTALSIGVVKRKQLRQDNSNITTGEIIS